MRGVPTHHHHHRTPLSETEVLRDLLRLNASFAAYRLPGQDVRVLVQHDTVLQPPQKGQASFVIAPFAGQVVCIQAGAELVASTERSSPVGPTTSDRPAPSDPLMQPGLDRAGYRKAVEEAVRAIEQGRLEKVVIARTLAIDLTGIDIGALYDAAIEALPAAFVALAHTADHGTWLGASPEQLLALHGDHVRVDAIAGTMPSATAPTDARAWGGKEQDEQEIVTRSIVKVLKEHGVIDTRTDGPGVKQAGNVAHLHTRISGRSRDVDPLALAAALHPTPAVGGTPKAEAIDLIHALEPNDRALYAGYWGPVQTEGAAFFVNIRCMRIVGTMGLLHVGAGITIDSDPELECDEVEQKARLWIDLVEAQRRSR